MKAILQIILCSLLTQSAFAQIEDGVPPGFDIWRTPGDGNTYYSMENEPIPAGFLCEDSAAFTGTLYFEGEPIRTYPEGALGMADTKHISIASVKLAHNAVNLGTVLNPFFWPKNQMKPFISRWLMAQIRQGNSQACRPEFPRLNN